MLSISASNIFCSFSSKIVGKCKSVFKSEEFIEEVIVSALTVSVKIGNINPSVKRSASEDDIIFLMVKSP